MKLKSDFGFIFWAHLLLIILAYSSPFLFRWQLILVGVLYLYIQQFIFQGCVLTRAQFGKDPYMTFHYRYLTMMGFNVDKKKLKFLRTWITPILVLLFALFWQLILSIKPLIF